MKEPKWNRDGNFHEESEEFVSDGTNSSGSGGWPWSWELASAALIVSMSVAESTEIPGWVIVALRFALLGGLVGTAIKMLILPLTRKPDDIQLARFVEEKNPGLEDRLVSAVEVVNTPDADRGPFRFLLIRDAVEATRRIRFDDLVNRQKFNAFAVLTVAFALALAVSLYFSAILFPYGSARLFAGLIEPPPGSGLLD